MRWTPLDGACYSVGVAFVLVQPSPIARRLLWHVLAIGWGTVPNRHRVGQARSFAKAGAQIAWIKSGHGELHLPAGSFQLRPGPMFWMFSTQRPRSWTSAKSFVASSIRFSGPNLEAWLEELDAARRPEIHLSRPALIYDTLEKLLRLVRGQPADWEMKVHRVLSAMLEQLLVNRKPLLAASKRLPEPVTRVFDAVEAEPDRAWKASDLAPIAGVSYSRLRSLFRNSAQESVHAFLQQRRLDRARLLLAQGELNVKQIAEKLHFGSEFYFSRFFKAHTGASPGHFRKHAELL